MERRGAVEWLLRIAVAIAFIYPAVSAYIDPLAWVGFFPPFVRDLFPVSETVLLNFFGLTEIVLALWILVGRRVFIPSIVAALYLFVIVAFNMASLDILFRDISILLSALALAYIHRAK